MALSKKIRKEINPDLCKSFIKRHACSQQRLFSPRHVRSVRCTRLVMVQFDLLFVGTVHLSQIVFASDCQQSDRQSMLATFRVESTGVAVVCFQRGSERKRFAQFASQFACPATQVSAVHLPDRKWMAVVQGDLRFRRCVIRVCMTSLRRTTPKSSCGSFRVTTGMQSSVSA